MATSIGPSFRLGTKELFLPTFNVALLRTPNLPANYARFHVPLWFSKLDLRDYLWHAYGVEIAGVRAYVQQQRVQQGRPQDTRPQRQRWHRPHAQKYMTAELLRPFVWPAEPASYDEWSREEVALAEKSGKEYQQQLGPLGDTLVNEERRKAMREQARALLEGSALWKPSAYKGASVQGLRR